MNTVTYDQVIAMNPCWLETPAGRYRLKRYADRLGGKATALDILALTRVPAADRLWLVLREDFIPAPILHEFACRCAERALRRAGVTDTRSWAAIRAKRDWLAGKIDDQQLAAAARDAAWDTARDTARDTAQAAAWSAAQDTAWAAAWDAAWAAAWDAAWAATLAAARDAVLAAARDAAEAAERAWQIAELTNMLQEAD